MTKVIDENETSSSGSNSENENMEQNEEESAASADERNEDITLDVSDTSSSENDDDDDEDANCDDENDKVPAREDRIRHKITERYAKSKGLRLYVRFPAKLPADDEELLKQAKTLLPLVTKVHRPRQNHARFCLVDFASKEDRDTALKTINKAKKVSKDNNLKRTVINVPRTESDEFVENLIKQKLKTLESRKAKRRLKKAGIVSNRADKFTSTLIITNLPKRTSVLEIRTAFPNAVDVQLKNSKAAVTLPSTIDARNVYKKPPTLSGILLKLRFDKSNNKINKTKNKKQNNNAAEIKSEIELEEVAEVVAEKKLDINNKKKPMVKNNLNKKRPAAAENAEDVDVDADRQPTTVAKKQKRNNSNKKTKKQI